MTKEEILQQVLDDFGKEQGFYDWGDYYYQEGAYFNEAHIRIIAERFAIAMCEEQKKIIAGLYEGTSQAIISIMNVAK